MSIITILFGMQWGSEGKGLVASKWAWNNDIAIRIGASNAGHTFYDMGRKYIARSIPCAWINPKCYLVIGRGAVINLDVLFSEMKTIGMENLEGRLIIDSRATIVTQQQIEEEAKLMLAEKIASTSGRAKEGIAMARCSKIKRDGSCLMAGGVPELCRYTGDTIGYIQEKLFCGDNEVMIEGSQGFMLGLNYGDYPFVTSVDVDPISLLAGVGIDPTNTDIIVKKIGVLRSYPIRVGGNSGPFGKDSKEISWEELQRRAGSPVPLIEKTTVTDVPRRIATFSFNELDRVCRATNPTEIILTFGQYIDYSVYGKYEITSRIKKFIAEIEDAVKIPVTAVTTGPDTMVYVDEWNLRKAARW